MGIARNLFKSYREHDCFMLAASISFFAMLSLIPLIMIATSAAGFVLGSSQGLFSQIISTITDVLPSGQDELTSGLEKIISGKSKIGGVGIGILFLSASLLFGSIERALNRIFESVKRRNFFHSRLISILLVFVVIFILSLPGMVSLFQAVLVKYNISIPLKAIVTSKISFIIFMIMSFVGAVMFIPREDVKFKYAVIGGVFFAAGLGIAKFIFKWYLVYSFDKLNLIYGSLGILVMSILWIYYLAAVLLLSSELVAVLQRRYGCQTNEANGSHE